MKTVIATDNGSISYDSTAKARQVKFKKGDEVTLPDFQADFLVKCKKAKEKPVKKAPLKKDAKDKKPSTEKSEDK